MNGGGGNSAREMGSEDEERDLRTRSCILLTEYKEWDMLFDIGSHYSRC
jgi:hypothetical protein